MIKNSKVKIDEIFNKFVASKKIHEATILIENTNGDFTHSINYGKKDIDSPLLMASITKLFTTACIFHLVDQGKLSLEDKITKYMNSDTLKGLQTYKGHDYTSELTIRNLLFQTSGLPDVFEEGKQNLRKQLVTEDVSIHFHDMITLTKELRAHFPPNKTNKAYYADINFEILGKIIEEISELPLHHVCKQFIFEPLKLESTYIPQSDIEFIPHIYYKDKKLHRPHFLNSCPASGAGITTSRELMTFIKAFFGNQLFAPKHLQKLGDYNKLQATMYPIQYGSGYMRIPLNGASTLFMGKGELIGHSGSTGAFSFYYPEKDLFFVGDVNQFAYPSLPIRLVMRLAMSVNT